ncbi:MAG: hypothetical protein RL323_1004, partial [Pseudomonadota bacterium]
TTTTAGDMAGWLARADSFDVGMY